MRVDGREPEVLRRIDVERNYLKHAEGSCLISCGNTRVICTATVDRKVPPFLVGSGNGWVTAEYGLLPRSTKERMQREATTGRMGGRTHEIKRFIGRCLRPVVNLKVLGERTIILDCDVIEADGGTRTLSVNGAFIALHDACNRLISNRELLSSPIIDFVGAVSVGMVDGKPFLDLCYEEDVRAEVDMNVVLTGRGKIIEIQGTAEHKPCSENDFLKMLELAKKGIGEIIALQKSILK